MKAFSYLRVSGRGQVEGDGFPRQREKIGKYAELNGIELVNEFRDEAISGTKELEDREGLTDLLANLSANGVRLVLVERADRFARDSVVSEILLRQFEQLGVKVVECEGGNDLTVIGEDNPTRKLVRQILAAVSEFDKSSIVIKLRAARIRKRRETGKCEGRKTYGTTSPEEAVVVGRVATMRSNGMTFQAIADQLNSENIPTRLSKKWAKQTVKNIIDG